MGLNHDGTTIVWNRDGASIRIQCFDYRGTRSHPGVPRFSGEVATLRGDTIENFEADFREWYAQGR